VVTTASFTAWVSWINQHGPLIAGLSCAVLVGWGLLRLLPVRRRRGPDARWASRRDLRRAWLLGKQGVVLGRIGRTVLRYHGRGHVFVTAGTQTGKSQSLVKPTLLDPQPQTSVLVFDPKGELHETTHRYRATVSRVITLAPCSPTSDCYNPLDAIRLESEQEVADVGLVAAMLANPEGRELHGGEQHFVELAESALRGLLLYGLYGDQVLCLGDLYTLVTQGGLRDAITAMAQAEHPTIRAAGELLGPMEEKQFSNVVTTLSRIVELYGDPLVAAMTTRSDFAVDALRHGEETPLTVYVSVPFTHLERTRGLTRLLFRQLLSRACDVPNDWQRQGYWKLLVMGEEFPSLKRLQIAADILNHGAGLGVQLCTISPSFNDIEDIWGIHHNFLDNSHVQVYFGITDEKVAERISRRLGTQTVKEDRVSWGRGGRSVSRAQIKRPLMDSSAITHMDANDILILARQHQVIAQQTPWDQYQPWAGRGTQYA
jgi:type IV secretion system protein VirD4